MSEPLETYKFFGALFAYKHILTGVADDPPHTIRFHKCVVSKESDQFKQGTYDWIVFDAETGIAQAYIGKELVGFARLEEWR